jgi:TRAP-type C4-dicarboxylate transport system substrate-binding protein
MLIETVESLATFARRWQRAAGFVLAGVLAMAQAQAQGSPAAPMRLRVVGGLAGVNQYTRHEEPFWTQRLAAASGGRYTAEIVPFDRAGIRAPEMLSLIELGAVPFGTALLSIGSGKDLELGAPDLAGLSPDFATLKRTVAAFRPYLRARLRARHGIELLAVYAYPAQVVFCKQAWNGFDGLKGRRVRTANATQSDWIAALGARPVVTPFAEILSNLRAGHIDCAVTGTMSGNTIGLDALTTHLHPMAISWGLSVFAANAAVWDAQPAELKALLERELPLLEQRIWDEADRETRDGVDCNVGNASCQGGRRGRMTALVPTPQDEQRRREIFADTVLPQWLQRCGPPCVEVWNRTLAGVSGVQARWPEGAR